MKKIGKFFLTLFALGTTGTLFAGAVALGGFLVAMIVGGEMGETISLFIHKFYFPWVIQICSIAVGCGLLGMYITKRPALTIISDTEKK